MSMILELREKKGKGMGGRKGFPGHKERGERAVIRRGDRRL